MVVIRLSRAGTKKKPFYHLAVTDKRNPRDGRFIERVGFYDPVARGQSEPLRIDLARVDHWIGVGAQLSPKVKSIVAKARKIEALKPLTSTEEAITSVEVEQPEVAVETGAEDSEVVVEASTEESVSVEATSDTPEELSETTPTGEPETEPTSEVQTSEAQTASVAESDTSAPPEETATDPDPGEVDTEPVEDPANSTIEEIAPTIDVDFAGASDASTDESEARDKSS